MDLRYTTIKKRLQELTPEERQRLLENLDRVCFDTFNYDDRNNTFCPLAVALNLHNTMEHPTDEKVTQELSKRFSPVNVLRGTPGRFYRHPHRRHDLEYLLTHWV
jgi:hypothetical protein